MLSQQLPESAKIGEFSLEKFGCHTDEKNSEKFQGELQQIFTEHKAVYRFIVKVVFWNTTHRHFSVQ